MARVARIFHRERDVFFDVQLEIELGHFMTILRTDGYFSNTNVFIPYDQIGLVLAYDVAEGQKPENVFQFNPGRPN